MNYIINISGQTVELYIGGTSVIMLEIGQAVNYQDYAVFSTASPNYNLNILQDYVDAGIITITAPISAGSSAPSLTAPSIIVNFSPAVPSSFTGSATILFTNLTSIDYSSAQFTWVITDASGTVYNNFTSGGNSHSINPIVLFNTIGVYSVTLNAVEAATSRSGSLSRTSLITIV